MIPFLKLPVEALRRIYERASWVRGYNPTPHWIVNPEWGCSYPTRIFRGEDYAPVNTGPKPLYQPEPENSHNQDRTAGLAAGSVLGITLPYVCPSCAQPSSCRPQDHPGAYLCENPQCGVFLFLPKI